MATSSSGGISFETQKFAFGQRIKLNTDSMETSVIRAAIDELTTVPGDLASILEKLFGKSGGSEVPSFGYDPTVKWLAGFDITYGVLTLDVLMVDGSFYGLLIKIGKKPKEKNGDTSGEDKDGNGEKEKEDDQPLAGLQLEIIYRKINDHLGEYSADLTLPKKYSTISIGEAPENMTLTLPAVGLEIFTNGDFKVSIGWPLGDRSFNITVPPDPIPWAGGGGLYFARLRSEDDPGSLGTDFNPIIEFGIGLRIGAASEGDYGIASYNASLYLFGTFQGFLAWEQGHSFSDGVDYYWFCASVGITGHLEGSVDFIIIKATLSLDVTASLTLAIETLHAATGVAEFKAEVEASIKIIFFTIHFSFGLDLKLQIEIGRGPAAKITGPSLDPSENSKKLLADALVQRSLAAVAPAMFLQEATPDVSPKPIPVPLSLLLQPTIRYDTTSKKWVSVGVASLVIERAAPTDASTTADLNDPFGTLMKGLAEFLLKNYAQYVSSANVTEADLDKVSAKLDDGKFTIDVIKGWLNAAGFTFTVNGVTTDTGKNIDGAIFPMIPGLSLTYNKKTTVFGAEPAPANYLSVFNKYLASLGMLDGGGASTTSSAATPVPPGPSWFPGVIFADYFNLVAKQLINQLTAWMTTAVDGRLPAPGTLDADLLNISIGNLAGIGTRFLQHGLQVPNPADICKPLVDINLLALYDMTGQQFDVVGTDLDATIGVAEGADKPAINVTIGEGKSAATLPFALTTPPADNPLWHPKALKRIIPMPLSTMLRQGVAWDQSPTKWQLFGFPDPLQSELRQQGSLSLNLTSTDGTNPSAPAKGMEALLIRFAINLIPGLEKNSNIFQVSGTNEETRDLIEHLFNQSAELAAAEIDLLLPAGKPNSGAGYKTGDAKSSMLLKTNLSSVSQPDVSAMFAEAIVADADTPPALGPTYAVVSTTPPTDFLRLLWECSIVHTGGFYLAVPALTQADFNGQKRLEIALLVKQKGAATSSTVAVDTYHNAVLVDATGLNTGDRIQADVFESDGTTRVTTLQPNYPAGTAAFGAKWDPAPVSPVPACDNATYAESLYQLLQYRLEDSVAFDKSPWSMPLAPNGPGNSWSYRRAAPVSRFLKTPSTNRYAAIAQTTTLDMQLVDVFGNAYGFAALPLTPVYNDRLIPMDEWPAFTGTYTFTTGASGSAVLTTTFSFQLDQVQQTKNAIQVYQTIYDQLTDSRASVAVTTAMAAAAVQMSPDPKLKLANFAKTILACLNGTGQAPAPLVLTGAVPTGYVVSGINEDLFPIWVSMVISRDVSFENSEYDYPAGFVSVTSPVSPQLDFTGGTIPDPAALRNWSNEFESAYDGFDNGKGLLKVLIGKPPNKVTATKSLLGKSAAAAVTSAPGDLWAVKWGVGVGVDVTFGNDVATPAAVPVYFAPVPLSTSLLTGPVDVYKYDTNGKQSATPTSKTFHGVDLDGLGRSFLQSFDNLLAPEMASAIAQIDAGVSFAALMQAKEDLAYYISSSVAWVFDDQLTARAGDQTAAQVRFRESLLAALGNDYTTSAIVQVPAAVSVTGTFESAHQEVPKLFGNVAPENPTDKTTLRQFTISTASLPVQQADSAFLTFLAGAAHPTDKADLCLKFSYDIMFIEHSFDTTDEMFGYVPSSWLRFVLPDTDPNKAANESVIEPPMGQLDIPIPLRSYPSPPHLVQQQAQASFDPQGTPANPPKTIAQALQWNYMLTVQRPVAAQDDLHLEIELNAVEKPPADKKATGAGLFKALARFQDQYPLIDLKAIKTQDPNAKTWLADVRGLIQGVATAWQSHQEIQNTLIDDQADETTACPAPVVWAYILQVPDETAKALTLAWNGTGTAPAWPTIGGVTGTKQTDSKYEYSNIPAVGWDQLQIVWENLNVVTMQSAETSAFIKRNEALSGCGGVTVEEATNPAFVYTTSTVTFANPVVPLLKVPGTITISDTSVTQAVKNDLIEIIMPPNPTLAASEVGLSIGTEYTFELVPGLTTSLPVLLANAEISNAATPPSGVETPALFGGNMVKALVQWNTDFQPSDANASMQFNVTVFAANSQQPLAQLLDVEAPITGTGWWAPKS